MQIPNIQIEDEKYIFHDNGKIWSKRFNKFLTNKPTKLGYIHSGNLGYFHRIIYEKFVGNINEGQCYNCNSINKLQIDHKNDIKYDNRVDNLQILCHNCNTQKQKKSKRNNSNIKGISRTISHKCIIGHNWRCRLSVKGKVLDKSFIFKYSAYICLKIWKRKFNVY